LEKRIKDIKSQESQQEDFDAIRRAIEGESGAYTFLQKKYKKIVLTLIRRMIKDEDDVDDLVQETFIKAFSALSSFQYGYSFSSWIYRIASNNCIDFLRKKRFTMVSISGQYDDSDEDHEMEIRDNSYQPDISLMNDEKKQLLLDAIEKLPENYREIIKMRHEEDMDYKEISDKLDLPLGTVKAHLFRARKILFEELKKHVSLFNEN
jgi:RNA polymerase sigma-70 factor (ECF subfamily)